MNTDMSSTKVWLTMTAEGIVWRDMDGKPCWHSTHESAAQEAEDDYMVRMAVWREEDHDADDEPDPIDEVVSGVLNADGSITLDDGYTIDINP